MENNESGMKARGEQKVWNTVITKQGNYKNISSTQIGQQLLLKEALEILPGTRDWIDNTSAKVYRAELQEYFKDDEILLEKITQSFLFLSGSIYNGDDVMRGKSTKTRHKKINTLRQSVLPDLSFDQVWRFLEYIISLSSFFDVEKLLNKDNARVDWNLRYTCNLSEVILEELALEAAKAFYPLPMLKVPVEWSFEDGQIKGGYENFQYEMVRASKKFLDYSKYSKKIFDSINYIQQTAWVVNEDILRQIKADLKKPQRHDYVKTFYPENKDLFWEIDLKKGEHNFTKRECLLIEKKRSAFREKASLYNAEVKDYESALGKHRAVKLALQIADQYIEKEIYFPHSYDFRGRIYPLPIGLSPQGSDAVKALLLYANVETPTDEGVKWNWAYLASLYGDDKLVFEERVERGKELIDEDYKNADEPYQFLSHQLELRKWLADPTYIPNTRIHLDACNSGSQFTSAITGDLKGCEATNVIPIYDEHGVQKREDAYILVAEKALKQVSRELKRITDPMMKPVLEMIRELLTKEGRKICKTPVMVSNYGGTAGGRADILWNMMRELGVDQEWITKKNANIFSVIVGDSIKGVLSGGKAFETYIQKMNNVIARANKPVIWTTGDGFYVVHAKNKELKAKQISCMLPGARAKTTIIKKVYSDKMAATKMRSAIAPNYIHSLDAELLRRTALKMKKAGIVNSDWIHDSFGCHPNNVSKMLEITKREFANLVKKDPLKQLDVELREQAPDTKAAIKELSTIKLPSSNGKVDVDKIVSSEWFFS